MARPLLCCMQLVMHDCDKPIKGPALCWAANYFTRLSASPLLSSPLFSFLCHFPGKYICYGEQSHAVLKKLSEHGKKMFLITNSPFDFV